MQVIVTAAIAPALGWLWRSRRLCRESDGPDGRLHSGEPCSLDYDLMLLAPAVALLVNTGASPPCCGLSARHDSRCMKSA
jgi:hypothetical protein